jgi:hypothetical protein
MKIVIAGDVTVDWYYWPRYSNPSVETETINWKLYDGLHIHPKIAGPILISQMLKKCCPETISILDQKPETYDDSNSEKWYSLNFPNNILHVNIELDQFPISESDIANKVYRVKNYLGVITPPKNEEHSDLSYPYPFKVKEDDKDAKLVVIHDIGNGFRDTFDVWPEAIREEGKNPIIIYYMNLPLFKGELWKKVHQNKRLILVLNAEDLRKLGANISRSLSWEKTALEFLWEINNNEKLEDIKKLQNVIVRFGTEGAIHYSCDNESNNDKRKNSKSKLYFDLSSIEGEFWDSNKFGSMRGISAVFVSSLTSKLISKFDKDNNISVKDLEEGIKEGIEEGLFNSQEFVKNGHGNVKKNSNKDAPENTEKTFEEESVDFTDDSFGSDSKLKNENEGNDCFERLEPPNIFDQAIDKLFGSGQQNKKEISNRFECIELPNIHYFEERHPVFWSILEEKTKDKNQNLLNVAEEIVKEGSSALKHFPVGSFGKLTTVDRAEIESFRSVMSIMKEYIYSGNKSRPLSIAVFGYPGSGKSFGITEVARVIDSENVKKIGFNVSQFTSVTDLASAFHRIRDISLKGKIPLVFFDEFDCTFENRPLGWLRYFLVPMQDGEFMDQGSMHPIGKSIFVFAGGIYKDFQQFCENIGINSNKQKDSKGNLIFASENFSTDKCPDFVSRLRGYVNILGPNKINENDGAYIIRRAIILRSLIEEKAPNIIAKKECNKGSKYRVNGTAKIDPKLLRILLTVSDYKHGARSMEAIIDMSVLRKYKSWEKASLPPKDQLELHIDGTESIDLLEKI